MIEINPNGSVDARLLYNFLGIKSVFANWINNYIKDFDFIEGKDFVKIYKKTKGRPLTEYELTVDMAKELSMLARNEKGKQARLYFISIQNQKQKGQSFEIKEIHALIDLSKAMTLVSIQQSVERRHFAIYNDKYTWYAYRAEILGYSTNDLIEAMQKVNRKHKSIRKSLVKLDSNELIRTGIIDFFIALGKDKEYAINAGNLCKKFASEMKLGNQIWDDTKENPLKINTSKIDENKAFFNKSNKDLKG